MGLLSFDEGRKMEKNIWKEKEVLDVLTLSLYYDHNLINVM